MSSFPFMNPAAIHSVYSAESGSPLMASMSPYASDLVLYISDVVCLIEPLFEEESLDFEFGIKLVVKLNIHLNH